MTRSPTPTGWSACARRRRRFGADIVGGPQVPVFADGRHARWAAHPVFAPPYARPAASLRSIRPAICLVGRDVLDRMGPPFLDLKFNFMGGGDFDFLSRAGAKGFRLGWCAEAKVREAVPARRRRSRLDPRPQPAQRRDLDAGRKEEARRDAVRRRQVFARSLALLGASPFRGAAQAGANRLAGHGALSRLCRARARPCRIRLRQ